MSAELVQKIPWNEWTLEVSRSRGPGGQNVNRTNSAVLLRWNLAQSVAFNERDKAKLLERLAHRLTNEGEILIRSEIHRDQEQNKKDCLRKLGELLALSLHDPKPRRATKPTRSSQRRRVDAKKIRSQVKQRRQKPGRDSSSN